LNHHDDIIDEFQIFSKQLFAAASAAEREGLTVKNPTLRPLGDVRPVDAERTRAIAGCVSTRNAGCGSTVDAAEGKLKRQVAKTQAA
jgi:hypothetical protein